jgi:signal transduction histidine kinase
LGGIKLINFVIDYKKMPYIIEEKGDIIEVNDMFLDLTEFDKEELLNQCMYTVGKNLLHINMESNFIDNETEVILFTKYFNVRFVTVYKHRSNKNNEIIYVFVEKANSRLENKFQFVNRLITDGKIGVGIYTAPDLMLIKANQKYLNYLPKPYNTKELVYGKYMRDFIPDFIGSYAEKIFTNVVKTDQSIYAIEKQGLILENDNRYWNNHVTPIIEDGKVKYVISMLEDVTERVLSREHIRVKNNQLEAILSSVNDLVGIFDKNGNHVVGHSFFNTISGICKEINIKDNEKYAKVYEWDGTEIEPKDLTPSKVLRGEIVNRRKVKVEINNEVGYFELSGKPVYDENSNVLYGVVVSHDITEETKKVKIIEQQKKELEAIIENMNDGLVVIDKTARFIRSNPIVQKEMNEEKVHLGMTISEIHDILKHIPKYYNENYEQMDLQDTPYYKVLKGEKVMQQRVILREGLDEQYLDFSGTPIFDEDGSFQQGIILSHDVTDIVKKENKIKEQQELILKAERERSEALEKSLIMKDEFISLISHEFKTPLNVMYLAIQLIEHMYFDQVPSRVKELIGTIKQNTFRQLRLTNNLLDITKLNSGQFKLNTKNIDIVFLTKVITKSVKLYANQKNIKLLFRSNVKCKNVSIDDEKYERILLNLLSNALKFTENGGKITVTLNENKKNNILRIRVTDTGIGIPDDKQELIFERFGQVNSNLSRQAEGTGIGLSLVKLLVTTLGGTIELKSKLDVGSTFIILLPIKEAVVDTEFVDGCLDDESRLVSKIKVEFSDIYL